MKKITIIIALILSITSCNDDDLTSQVGNLEPPTSEQKITDDTENESIDPRSIPIVLVPGFFGYGEDEGLGLLSYFGGVTENVAEKLKIEGYKVYVADVSPFSSNHDRAVELYHQIKGGCLDFGKGHSEKFGHKQTVNKCHEGFYPEWDENHPVHLIGHSMGGQTIRVLNSYLNYGSIEEEGKENTSELFKARHNGWIKSLTSVSTPHNGTSLTVINTGKILQNILPLILAPIGILGSNSIYDFDLEQWSGTREEGQSLIDYVLSLPNIFKIFNTKDISAWDLSIEGAQEMNQRIQDPEDVYYFSITNKASLEIPLLGIHLFAPLLPNPVMMLSQLVTGDSSWNANDGVVNTASMSGPEGSPINEGFDFDQTAEKGIWNSFEPLESWDHFQTQGLNPILIGTNSKDPNTASELYLRIVQMLEKLP